MVDSEDDDWQFSEVFEIKGGSPVEQPEPAPVIEPAIEPVIPAKPAPVNVVVKPLVPAPVYVRYHVDHPDALKWASERCDGITFRDDAHSLARTVNDEFVGVVVYDTFGPNDCLVHVASDGRSRWMTREFIVRAMAYPFHQLKFNRITCLISETNQDSLILAQSFGWTLEGRQRKAAMNRRDDLIMFGMLRAECRWLFGARKPLKRSL